jgi:hypothetical protein
MDFVSRYVFKDVCNVSKKGERLVRRLIRVSVCVSIQPVVYCLCCFFEEFD